MTNEEYIRKLKDVKKNIEGMLNFEKRALSKWGNCPTDENKRASWYENTEPIARAVMAYETSLGYLLDEFPELKEKK